jgi:hypothetical protein
MRRLLLIALLLLPASLLARDFKSEGEAREFSDAVMREVATGNLKGGFDRISEAYSVVPRVEIDAIVSQAMLQVPVMEARFGKSIGQEFISESRAGDSVLKYVYLHKFEKHAIVWQFVFYRPDKAWLLNSFKYSDSVLDEL